ncbi:MAG: single-stranded-DNA-specific exonuclease RecJ [Alphaproteobacteria bacterium]
MTLSILGKHWTLAEAKRAAALAQGLALPEVVARVLAVRQPQAEVTELLHFLTPKLTHLPDPLHLVEMEAAVQRLTHAITHGEQLAIFGDYDVDGACASAFLLRYFRALGSNPVLYVPDRLTEGYGPNPAAMEKLAAAGVKLIVTVDCGSTAHAALERAQALGMDVIVTDHHQAPLPLPPCVALVNPNRVDETSPCTMLCGAGMAFFLAMATSRTLRTQNFFTPERKEPDLRHWLDLIAVATIADMVPLVGVNRVLVHFGMQVLNRWGNAGLAALAQVASKNNTLPVANGYTVGFQLGPRINAAGRLAESTLGATLLSMDDPAAALDLATRLDKLNTTRQEVQAEVLELALRDAEAQAHEPAIVLAGSGWHAGVVGIVAARVKEQFHRPTFVLAVGEEGTATGSGRSITGVDLGRAVHACMPTLIRGGGHGMAAGVTVKTENIAAFTVALRAHIQQQVAGVENPFTPQLRIDGMVQPATLTETFLSTLNQLEPYGTGHAEPTFALCGVTLADCRSVGATGAHLKLRLQGADGTNIEAIAFGAGDNALGGFFSQNRGQHISVAGHARLNTYMGRSKPDVQVADAHLGTWLSQ